VAAAGLMMSYFDPIVFEKEPQFSSPRHIGSEVLEERPGTWFIHSASF